MKLGELLVKAGKITPAQLEEVLKDQAIFGGRFGTNLVEMGYLDEHDLAHFLSKKAGIPHAAPEQLMDVPPQVIRLIPLDTAKKYRVMPVALNNRKLTVAMTDPTDFAVIDEISFITGYIVVPMITPELRLVTALEKHYNIRRDMRYIRTEAGGRNRGRQDAAKKSVQEPPRQPVPVAPAPNVSALNAPAQVEPDDDILELPLLAEYQHFDADPGYAEPLHQPVVTGNPVAHPEPEKEFCFDDVLLGLTQAHDRNAIAELIVSYASQQFDRSALFMVKGEKATGWAARCMKKPVPGFDLLEIPLTDPSVLKVVTESKSYYLGPVPASHYNSRVINALGGGSVTSSLLVPLIMMGRVVAVLYVEGGKLSPDQGLAEMQRLVGKASMAFEILILKSKILLT